MDIIRFCSVSVTISRVKLHCFNALRRWKFSVCMCVCVCVCINVRELSQFPFQMSSYLRGGEQRQSQRPLFHRRSFRRRQKGGGTSATIYGSAGIPPRDRAAHLYSPHVSAHTTGKLTGWWARRERGGDRSEGARLHRPRWSSSSSLHSDAIVLVDATCRVQTQERAAVHSQKSLARRGFKNKITRKDSIWQSRLCKDRVSARVRCQMCVSVYVRAP